MRPSLWLAGGGGTSLVVLVAGDRLATKEDVGALSWVRETAAGLSPSRLGVVRSARAVGNGALCIGDYWLLSRKTEDKVGSGKDQQGGTEIDPEALAAVEVRCADRVYQTCRLNGGIYTKLGQYLSTMQHILPPAYVEALKPLQDQQPPSPWNSVKRAVERDLGQPLKEVFSDFNPDPIASASIAQVHEARLCETGERVAVKIQHPNLRQTTANDMFILRGLATAIAYVWPAHAYTWLLPEFETTLRLELDFVQEACNAERTKRLLRQHHPKVREREKERARLVHAFHACLLAEAKT